MRKAYEKMDFVDLMSERHGDLRTLIEELTNKEIFNTHLSSSEWYIIAKIYKNKSNLVELNQSVSLTRQAVHKAVQKLKGKEIAVVNSVAGNKKEKSVSLTDYGEKCYEKYIQVKESLEVHIQNQLGIENMKLLKKQLSEDWCLKDFKIK